jgi:hypothetical protein
MRHSSRFLSAAAASAALIATAAVAIAQTPSPQAVKAAHDATRAARKVTIHLAGGDGTVSLVPIGRTRTRVRISVPQGSAYRFRLYPGSDCSSNRGMAASAIALAPMNQAGNNAAPSETIVNLPIEKVSQNYVVDAQSATTNAQVASACARLTH